MPRHRVDRRLDWNTKPVRRQIQSLKLRDFKGVAALDLPFDESLTLLAGVNGVGKTTVIEASLAAVTWGWNHLAEKAVNPWFRPDGKLVREGASEGEVALDMSYFKDVTLMLEGVVSEQGLTFHETTELTLGVDLDEMSFVAAQQPPLIVYYDQKRIGGLTRDRNLMRIPKDNRDEALDTTPHALTDFETWFFEKEGDEAREARERRNLDYVDPELGAVRQVLKAIAGEAAALRSRKPEGDMERVLLLQKDPKSEGVPFEALSGGEQAFFLLAVDLARRLILEFPDLPISEAPGFVCIDEIELHLHPAWQREILAKLMSLFRGCQFLVSTHSPQVIGSVEAKHVRLLVSTGDGRVTVTQPLATRGRDSNYVLEGVLDTPERDPAADKLFDEFDDLVDAGEFDAAERVLDKLDDLIDGGAPQITVRRAKCLRLRRAARK